MHRRADGTVVMHAWGPGAAWSLEGLPALMGAGDEPGAFVAHHPLVADAHRRMAGLRFGATLRVWDQLFPAILEQKVTGTEARRSWRELVRRFGDPAPGPVPDGLRVPPHAEADPRHPRLGVAQGGRRPRPRAARSWPRPRWRTGWSAPPSWAGPRAASCCAGCPASASGPPPRWPSARWGDADAVSFGDFHIPTVVGWALLGRPLDDAGLAEVLAPYKPQRQRAVRYVESSGFRRPRFGPRFSPRDYRAI